MSIIEISHRMVKKGKKYGSNISHFNLHWIALQTYGNVDSWIRRFLHLRSPPLALTVSTQT